MSDLTIETFDENYRPSSYFWAQELGLALTPRIQGAARRRMYEEALAEGRALPPELMQPELSACERRAWSSLHPAAMGGEYLPRMRSGELEVARIVIASTTYDVTCVYAKPKGDRVALRVVDEYEGDTLKAPVSRTVSGPLSLKELLDFFLRAWNLLEVLEMNFGHGSPAEIHSFIASATSSFYPGFEFALRERVDTWLAQVRSEEA